MQDQIRQTIVDLVLLGQTMNNSERKHLLKTVERFRNIVGVDDYPVTLYGKLFFGASERLPSENVAAPGRLSAVSRT
jgi:hypothetical protein